MQRCYKGLTTKNVHCKHGVRRGRYYVHVVPCTVPYGTGFHHPRANVLSEAVYISLYISRTWSS
jgi:hypothetical protein